MSIPVIEEVRPGSLPWFLYLVVCAQDDDCMGICDEVAMNRTVTHIILWDVSLIE